jgi:hypothetical protein
VEREHRGGIPFEDEEVSMARTEWVSGRDGAFFLLESATTPYHAGGLILLEGPAIAQDELLAAVARKLALLPRFRQRLAYPALVNRPVWIDDPHFDLEFHVRRTSLPDPGSGEQLSHVVAGLMEEHVSRFRPLWELWMIDGLATGDCAVLLKMHHAMADGVTGARDVMLLFDEQPARRGARSPTIERTEPWLPRPADCSPTPRSGWGRDRPGPSRRLVVRRATRSGRPRRRWGSPRSRPRDCDRRHGPGSTRRSARTGRSTS